MSTKHSSVYLQKDIRDYRDKLPSLDAGSVNTYNSKISSMVNTARH
jgi:hypothetical protein